MRPVRALRPLPSVPLRIVICSILIIGVGAVTTFAHSMMQQRVYLQADLKFAEITDSYFRQLTDQLEESGNVLYATQGLFAAADVDAAAWERFIQMQHSFDRYPGLKAIGYAEVVPGTQQAAYNARLQQDLQLPTASIYPRKAEGDYVPLTYLWEARPTPPRGTDAYGFDLTSEPHRRTALEQARATGSITATAPIMLSPSQKPGFLLVLSLSNKQAVSSGAAGKITGYGVATFDAESFLGAVLGPRLAQYKTSMSIADISGPQPLSLYHKAIVAPGRKVQRDIILQVANRSWRITFQTPASILLMVTDRWAPLAVLLGGTLVILTIGALLHTLTIRKRYGG